MNYIVIGEKGKYTEQSIRALMLDYPELEGFRYRVFETEDELSHVATEYTIPLLLCESRLSCEGVLAMGSIAHRYEMFISAYVRTLDESLRSKMETAAEIKKAKLEKEFCVAIEAARIAMVAAVSKQDRPIIVAFSSAPFSVLSKMPLFVFPILE